MPARRQFSVQTGVVWRGVMGILLDAECAECHRRTDILGGKRKKRKKKKVKRNLSDKCSFLPETNKKQKKATQLFWSVLKITN